MHRIRSAFVTTALALGSCAVLATGCSGGNDGSTLPVRTSQARVTNAQTGGVTFAVLITPKAKIAQRTPQYISPSTLSLSILTDGSNPVIVELAPSAPNCSPDKSQPGSYICTAKVTQVPAGTHVFTVSAYATDDASGPVLSTNSTGPVYVPAVGDTTVSLVLQGVVSYVIITLTSTYPTIGTPASIGLLPVMQDAFHNIIIGPAPFDNPVTLTTTDPADAPLSKTVLNAPADASGITANYNGAPVASITFSATATGLTAANVTNFVLSKVPVNTSPRLYVSNLGIGSDNTVSVFDLANAGAPPAQIAGAGIDAPQGAAVDALGRLYVANFGANNISVFDTVHGYAALPPISGGGLSYPAGVVVDASGRLYVANSGARTVSIFDTAHGNAVLPPISGSGLYAPISLALDATGKLYVTNYGQTIGISVFDTTHGNAILPSIPAFTNYPTGMAIDATGKLYVTEFESFDIRVFDTAHGNTELPAISLPLYVQPTGAAVDASGKLYIALPDKNSISVYDTLHGNAALSPITGGLSYPYALAVH